MSNCPTKKSQKMMHRYQNCPSRLLGFFRALKSPRVEITQKSFGSFFPEMKRLSDDLGVGFHEAWNYPRYRYIRLLVATCCDDADAPIVIDNTLSRHYTIKNPKSRKINHDDRSHTFPLLIAFIL